MKRTQIITATTVAILLSHNGFITPTQANPTPSPSIAQLNQDLQWQPPPPPDSLGEPGGRGQGAGSRGDCQDYKFVVPLVPRTNPPIRWGQTTSAQPHLWLYAPLGIRTNLSMLDIRLLNQEGETVARKRTKVKAQPPGTIAIPFPELKADATYWWQLDLYCKAGNQIDTPITRRGMIKRITPSAELSNALRQVTAPADQVKLYAANGLWFDALETISKGNIPSSTRKRLVAELFRQSQLSNFASIPSQE